MDARQATALVLVVPPAEGDVAMPVAEHAVEGPHDDGTDGRSGNDTERGRDASASAIFVDVD